MGYEGVIKEIEKVMEQKGDREDKLQQICHLLHKNIPHYNWVGFYMADEEKRELLLGPFVGEPTEHIKISFGRGICGQAAVEKATFIVQDVSKETNYLSCSPRVKSEMVVPIIRDGRMVAQLDIDSHKINAFGEEDRRFLEEICKKIAILFD